MTKQEIGLVVAAGLGVPALLIAGLVGYVSVANRHPVPVSDAPSFTFREQKEHPVTPEMLLAAKELGKEKAADFGAPDSDGRWYTLANLTKGKPLVMFFIELECPCCKGAKEYIDRIHKYYGDVCNVVGVINADVNTTKQWERLVGPKFTVLSDPRMEIIQSYKATRGVYTTLVAPGGKIVEVFPGYSQEMLGKMATSIEKLAAIAPRHMPVKPAPVTMTSGCLFPGAKVSVDQL